MNLKSYIAPTALVFLTLIAGIYLLVGSGPSNNKPAPDSSALDPEVMQHFSFKAEQYAKENAEGAASQPSKKAGNI